jgi:hypothetical protein
MHFGGHIVEYLVKIELKIQRAYCHSACIEEEKLVGVLL